MLYGEPDTIDVTVSVKTHMVDAVLEEFSISLFYHYKLCPVDFVRRHQNPRFRLLSPAYTTGVRLGESPGRLCKVFPNVYSLFLIIHVRMSFSN